ncbi:type II secretion system F family protein [Planctomonas deserti]|uniref:type II secretion system F family protein n=1 Tax=Planctomonas deserti TaxID=2144185 RepID=UPI001F0BA91B|nr:type II secretion system F family protein [Planctomonas deserti]
MEPVTLVAGLVLCYLALALLTAAAFAPAVPRLPLDRRRPDVAAPDSGVSRFASATTGAVAGALASRRWDRALASALDQAGVRKSPAEFVVLTASAGAVNVLVGVLLGSPGLALLLALATPLGAVLLLRLLKGRRQRQFADQLDDTLQLVAGGLRAGHSLLRAVDAVSHEAESPTREEFARIVNETRLGRDLNDALENVAARMKSEDFSWVAQAIGIHREVGGDLAEVLDQVGATIRERNQLRRQVQALSSEGKMSAYVLMALPFVVTGILAITSPTYIAQFGQSPLGFALIGVAVVMLTVGALWLRKVVSFSF